MTDLSTQTAASLDTTMEDVLDSLTGYDEIAIEKHFDLDPYTDGEEKGVRLLRALVFIHQTRQDMKPADAREFAMTRRVGDLDGYFADPPEESPENDEDAAGGNGDSPSEREPNDSPPSA